MTWPDDIHFGGAPRAVNGSGDLTLFSDLDILGAV